MVKNDDEDKYSKERIVGNDAKRALNTSWAYLERSKEIAGIFLSDEVNTDNILAIK